MRLPTRRTGFYLLLVVATTLLFTVVYNTGMAVWEGRTQPLYRSLEVVIQSFTTTGYGEDAPWQTPQMNALVILMQFAGIGLILTAVDVFAVPWLREALSPTVPEVAPEVSDHVVVCGHTPRTEAFLTELDARDQSYVLVEPDEETAADRYEAGYQVIHGDPESTAVLANARIGEAVAVVADEGDDTNASIALSAHDVAPGVKVITLVTDSALRRYHRAAGVDAVLSPRQLLGESLAARIPTTVTAEIESGIPIGDDFELVELVVGAESEFAGRRFEAARLRERFGITVIGAWFNGAFVTPVDAADTLDPGARLLVAGEPTALEALRDATAATVREFATQHVLLAGHGDAGEAAAAALREAGSELSVLDIESGPAVDTVGDARDPDVLEAAGIEAADALVVTVADDTTAIFVTLIARELNPDLEIVVRANERAGVDKLYRAGADYVQSLASISGRMLAETVFDDEAVLAYSKQVSVVRLPAGGLAGTTLAAEAVRTETGSTVIAVLRDGETITDVDPQQFTFERGDDVIIAGDDDAIRRFEDRYTA
ncbi:potassium channel family protein [Halohasta salina]|uniref:potassium channel family protein n=1 Tax=Halohasta salina TaxID=2961621 RepID=UPI0020A32BF0|nr:NAD-binding protein [Halohasta salina]